MRKMGVEARGLYLGIDAGGTHTVAVLMSEDGEVLGVGAGGPGNHVAVGLATARASLAEAIQQACGGRTPALLRVTAVAFGSAGLEEPGDVGIARNLLPENIESEMVVFDTDALVALEGALAGEPGIVVVAGTGAIAFGRDVYGHRAYASGWGWRVGDEGSAYWIAARALQAISRSLDGRGPKTAMLSAMLASLHLPDWRALRDWIYAPDRAPANIAALAQVVVEAARAGDVVAATLLDRAADELARAAAAVYRRLHRNDVGKGSQQTREREETKEIKVSFAGGVFRSDLVRQLFAERLLRQRLPLQIQPPLLPPCGGAALLAWRLGHYQSWSGGQGQLRQGVPACRAATVQENERYEPGPPAPVWQARIPGQVVKRLREGLAAAAPSETLAPAAGSDKQ